MKTAGKSWSFGMLALLLYGALGGWAWAAPMVTVTLDNDEMAMGDSAQLTITVSGGDKPVSPPTVPGLEFVYAGQSSQFQFVNGTSSSSLSVIYEVNPQHPGTFTIPALTPGGQALILKVHAADGSLPAANGSPSAPDTAAGTPPPSTASGAPPTENKTQMAANGAAFIRFTHTKGEYFVGESVPVEIQLGVDTELVTKLEGLPTINNDAIAMNNLSTKPEQHQELVDGRPYAVLTWHTLLTALKPGDFTLSLEVPLRVLVPNNRGMSGSRLRDPFNDPLIQSFFGGTTEKAVSIKSEAETIKVLPLPSEGRPDDFSGAVGIFTVSSSTTGTTANLGDPITLRMNVTGTGNFDRVNTSMLAPGGTWKSYKPTAKFNATDMVGFSGEKNFEQAIISLKDGPQTVPPLSFSYFNPETRKYETRQTQPINLTINPGANGTPGAVNPGAVASVTPAVANAGNDLRADHVEHGGTVATLCPLYYQNWFLGGQASLLLGFIGFWIVSAHREKEALDTEKLRKKALSDSVQQWLGEMEAAVAAQDSVRFFTAARAALQHQLALHWQLTPTAITSAEVEKHLVETDNHLRQIFALADQMAYSGQQMTSSDLAQWGEVVRQELARISG